MEVFVARLSIRRHDSTPIQSMNVRDLVGELFQLDKDIRWVGVVDQGGSIVHNAQRPGTESYVDPKTEERTLKEFPTIMGLFWRELVGSSGQLHSVLIAYSRVYLLAFYVEDYLIVLSFEPHGMPSVVNRLEAKYGSLLPRGDLDNRTT